MQKAQLITISGHPENPWQMFGAVDIDEPYPVLQNQEPGYYAMVWNFITRENTLHVLFEVENERGDIVDSLTLPAMPYFSGTLVTLRTSEIFQNSKPLQNALRKLFADETNQDSLYLANLFMNRQTNAFVEKMNQWISFENPEILNSLGFMISTSMSLLSPGMTINETLVILPDQAPE